ncbi:MAG: tRNA-dihydrouridine synthase [Anaerolineaceae bacterium]|nr:tRNA-dihydrouridine synthase [Anaerolineaceae bacterium]
MMKIGDIGVQGDVILAPMDGISDHPFRSLAKEFGSAISYAEFINAREVLSNIKLIQKKVVFDRSERPVAFQVYDDDPLNILEAALRLMQYKPDILDVNLGCSVKAVANRGAGAGLLKQPDDIRRTFELLTTNLDVPITAKIRLGWDEDTLNYLEIARIIEGSGGKAIAMHGRTRMQTYSHPARWEAIKEVKQAIKIPVIGNGDIRSVADIDRMIGETGCDAVMIGRAAVGNPWILRRQEKSVVSRAEVIKVTLEHLQKSVDFYGELNGVRKFRKFLKRYLEGLDIEPYRMQDLLSEEDTDNLVRILHSLLNK